MTASKGFDLGSVDTVKDCNAGAEFELRHPTNNKPTGVFITVLGKDSDAFREHIKDSNDADERREFMAQKRGKQVEPKTSDEQEEAAINLLSVCVVSWRTETADPTDKKKTVSVPTITFGDVPLECNGNNVKKVLRERLWVRRQVDQNIGDMELFTKA